MAPAINTNSGASSTSPTAAVMRSNARCIWCGCLAVLLRNAPDGAGHALDIGRLHRGIDGQGNGTLVGPLSVREVSVPAAERAGVIWLQVQRDEMHTCADSRLGQLLDELIASNRQ